uniref:Methyltransferase domain-containing protein n=1 Tax=Eptatretus burgeri TaxID=7764 RepID=A0A8C4N716_EPTBU
MALLTKDDVPRIRENLRTCADFLRSVRFVLDVNSFEFYTKGAWCEHVVPALCPRDVIGAAREFGASAAVIRENCDHTWGIDVHQQKLVNVNLFLRAAAHHTLAGLGFLLSTRDIFHLFQSSVHTEFQEPSLMCDKKCHEVALLSRLVVALVQHCSLNQDSVLVGLHTCGNLGSNILRVFLCHKQLRALSNVGCCYHLLTETSPLGADAEDPCGFPMSQFLLKSGFMLGRNMKMTACLAPERAARGKGLPNESLFRWAVLQVIIRDRFKHVSTTQHIGKVCNKTASFLGYCRKAFVLLGLDDSQISDDDITAYHDSYAPRAHELEAFNTLKAALSPCVEAIIFLDRLSFLLEQDLSCHAALVSLFDPAKSPRHYAIVAVKDKQ